MKMVSAAKLKKTESVILSFLPYRDKLNETLSNYLCTMEEKVSIPLAEPREVKRVAIIAFTSDSGLCGVFNANVNRLFRKTYDEYAKQLGADQVELHLFGKKISDYAAKNGIVAQAIHPGMDEQLSYEMAAELSDLMTERFLNHEIDRVVMVYNHYKNAGVQVPQCETLLPFDTQKLKPGEVFDYIVEPSKEAFVNALAPKVIRTQFYSIMLDTLTAEQGARMTAMHIASDNANSLLQDLRREYNRVRQNVITTELIDIVGGAEALNH
jgi:F-type H+-transporting ATPase subunit gamma